MNAYLYIAGTMTRYYSAAPPGGPAYGSPDGFAEVNGLISWTEQSVILDPDFRECRHLLRVPVPPYGGGVTQHNVLPDTLGAGPVPANYAAIGRLDTVGSPISAGFPPAGGYIYAGLECLSYTACDHSGFDNVSRAQLGTRPQRHYSDLTRFRPAPGPVEWLGQCAQLWIEIDGEWHCEVDGFITGTPQMTPEGYIEVQLGDLLSGLQFVPDSVMEVVGLAEGYHIFTTDRLSRLPAITYTVGEGQPWATMDWASSGVENVGGVNYYVLYIDGTLYGNKFMRGMQTAFYFDAVSNKWLPRHAPGRRAVRIENADKAAVGNRAGMPAWAEQQAPPNGHLVKIYFDIHDTDYLTFHVWTINHEVCSVFSASRNPAIGGVDLNKRLSVVGMCDAWERGWLSPNSGTQTGHPVRINVSGSGVQVEAATWALELSSLAFADEEEAQRTSPYILDYDVLPAETPPSAYLWPRARWRIASGWYSLGEAAISLTGALAGGLGRYALTHEDSPEGLEIRVTALGAATHDYVVDPLLPQPSRIWFAAEEDFRFEGMSRSASVNTTAPRIIYEFLRSINGDITGPDDTLPFGLGLSSGQVDKDSFESFDDPAVRRIGGIFLNGGVKGVIDSLLDSLNARLVVHRDGQNTRHIVRLAPMEGTPPSALLEGPLVSEYAIEAMPTRVVVEPGFNKIEYTTIDGFSLGYRDLTVAVGDTESIELVGVRGRNADIAAWAGAAASRMAAQGHTRLMVRTTIDYGAGLALMGIGSPFIFRTPAPPAPVAPGGGMVPDANGDWIVDDVAGVVASIERSALSGQCVLEAELHFTRLAGWAPAIMLDSSAVTGPIAVAEPYGPSLRYFIAGDKVRIYPRGEMESAILRTVAGVNLLTVEIEFTTALPTGGCAGWVVRFESHSQSVAARESVYGFAWYSENWLYY